MCTLFTSRANPAVNALCLLCWNLEVVKLAVLVRRMSTELEEDCPDMALVLSWIALHLYPPPKKSDLRNNDLTTLPAGIFDSLEVLGHL